MNLSDSFDSSKERKIPMYETSVEKPVYSQGAQPYATSEMDFSQREIPIYYQEEEVVRATVSSCFHMMAIQLIPIFGILMLFSWAFSKDNNYVRRILSRAMLIFYPLVAAVGILLYLALTSFI